MGLELSLIKNNTLSMAHITKIKSPRGKQTTVIMKKCTLSLFVFISFILTGMSQGLGVSLDDINENRILFDLDEMTEEEQTLINSIPEMELIYTTTIGNIGVYKVTEFPFSVEIDGETVLFSNIIEVNTGLRPGTGNNQAGTETDNFDFKSMLTPTDDGGFSASTNPFVCTNYSYELRAQRNTIRVAIFDSGINTHFDIDGYNPNVVHNSTMIGELVNDNEAEDDNNHGTHIAHIVHKISGSVQGNFVEYLNYKVVDGEGNGYMADLIMAADKAVIENRANILNISLSSVQGSRNFLMNKFFNAMLEHNVLVVTSSGNNGEEISASNNMGMYGTPANFFNVGSIDCNNTMSLFSNYGSMTNIYIAGEEVNSYDLNGDPYYYSGTSQAAGVLTGMAASLATHQDQFNAVALKCAIVASLGNETSQYIPTVDIDDAYDNLGAGCLSQFGKSFGDFGSNRAFTSSVQEIYPNPAFDNITITTRKGSYTVTINDVLGKNILSQKIEGFSKNNQTRIDLPTTIQQGFHYITILNNDTNEVSTEKIMIMK